ncbi:MAG: hypothetical protein ACK5JS_06540 [Mangrovibacterium sp.]
MLKLVIILIVMAASAMMKAKRKGNPSGSMLEELFGSNESAEEQLLREEAERKRREAFFASLEEAEAFDVDPVVQAKEVTPPAKAFVPKKPEWKAKNKPEKSAEPMQVEIVHSVMSDFDLRKAVIYTEIMNPKYKE